MSGRHSFQQSDLPTSFRREVFRIHGYLSRINPRLSLLGSFFQHVISHAAYDNVRKEEVFNE